MSARGKHVIRFMLLLSLLLPFRLFSSHLWLVSLSSSTAPELRIATTSVSSASASSLPIKSSALVIVADHKYALWAIQFLDSLLPFIIVDNNGLGMSIECILVGNITASDREDLNNRCHHILDSSDFESYLPHQLRDQKTTVHWYKLLILTHSHFRKFHMVRYIDVDHIVHSPINWDQWTTMANSSSSCQDEDASDDGWHHDDDGGRRTNRSIQKTLPAAMMAGGCRAPGGRWREFVNIARNVTLQKLLPQSSRDRKDQCLSTRIMAFAMDIMPSSEEMVARIDTLLSTNFPPKAFRFWELGFLQLLFWNDTQYLNADFGKIHHMYHVQCKIGSTGQCMYVSQ